MMSYISSLACLLQIEEGEEKVEVLFFMFLEPNSRLPLKRPCFDAVLLLLRAVLQQQSQRAQVSLGSGVVNGEGARIRGSPGVSLAALQQPLGDLVVAEAGRQVKDGGAGAVPVLRGQTKTGTIRREKVTGLSCLLHVEGQT